MSMQESTEPVVESAAPEVTEPVVEAPPVETTEPVVVEATEPVVEAPATEAPDPFHEFGGRETIEAAHRMYEASRTEDGVIALFLEAGRNLGLGLKEMETLFTQVQGEQPEPPDPDEPLTRGEFEAMIAKQNETAEQRREAAAKQAAGDAVRATVQELGLDPADPATQTILNLADRHIKGDDLSPKAVAAAVRQGHADFNATVEKKAQEYLASKQAKAASVPGAPSGSGAPSEPPAAEPKDTAEAIKIARRQLAARA